MNKIAILSIIGALIFTISCKKDPDPGTLEIVVKALYNGQPFEIGEIYEDHLGHRIRVDVFKTYISDIIALEGGSAGTMLKDIDLIDFENSWSANFELEEGDYNGISFGIGVPPDRNKDQDPNQYPNDHPLSVNGAQGMFWFWNTGYIFSKYEGKVDLDGIEGNELVDPFAFHCGEDFLFETHLFNGNSFSISSNETTRINIIFNVEDFLNNGDIEINLEDDYLTHTSGNVELAEKFMTCFNDAIEVTIE